MAKMKLTRESSDAERAQTCARPLDRIMEIVYSCRMIGWFFMVALVGTADSAMTINAVKTTVPPRIDGVLEPVWASGDSAKNFTASWPVEGQPPSESTTVYLLSDDANLYVAYRCFDDPVRIRAWVTLRDQGWGDDVGLVIAPLGDNVTGYKFSVNARNVQVDAVLTADGREADADWDGVWFSAARIDDFGYAVEMRIPFAAVRYRPGLRDWGINFKRSITRTGEQLWWTPVRQNEGVRLSKAGRVAGIAPVRRGFHLEAYPVGLIRYEKDPPRDPSVTPDGGFDLNWFPSGATGLALTVNPDFAQIEADPYRVNLSKYELYLDERRSFFTERAELFKPANGVNLFYSRRVGKRLPDGQVVPIRAGVKFTTRFERFDLGLLSSATGPVSYTDYSGAIRTEPGSFYSVARVNRNLFVNSSIGILYAGRDGRSETGSGDFDRVVGVDGAFRTSGAEVVWGGARSFRSDSTDDRSGDWAGSVQASWLGKHFFLWTGGAKVGNRFDISDIGYVSWPGSESYYVAPGFQIYQRGPIRYCSISTSASASREAGDPGFGPGFALSIAPKFTNNWAAGLSYQYVRTFEQDRRFSSSVVSLDVGTDWGKPVFATVSGWWTDQIPYYLSGVFSHFAPQAGGEVSLAWKPSPGLDFELAFNPTVEYQRAGRIDHVNWIFRPSVNYALTNDLYLRIYVQPNLETQIHDVNILVAWNFKPKSWVYFALNETRDNNLLDEQLVSRTVVLKAKYLFSF